MISHIGTALQPGSGGFDRTLKISQMQLVIDQHVHKNSNLKSDEQRSYFSIGKQYFSCANVNHSKHE